MSTMSNIKSYSYSYDCIGRIDKDYVDNIIVRMYFGKVCDGTLSEQQFMQRLHELWAVNPYYKLVKVKAIGDSSKISTVMDIKDSNTLINIPTDWPENPTCDIRANSKCRLFSECIRLNDVPGQSEARTVVNTLVNSFNEYSSQQANNSDIQGPASIRIFDSIYQPTPLEHRIQRLKDRRPDLFDDVGVSGPPIDTGNIGEPVSENVTSDDLVKQAKDIPWGWIAIGGLAFVGSIIMIAAIKSSNEYGSSSEGIRNLEEPNLVKMIRKIAIDSANEAYYGKSRELKNKVAQGYIDRASEVIGRKLTDYEQSIFVDSFNKRIREFTKIV